MPELVRQDGRVVAQVHLVEGARSGHREPAEPLDAGARQLRWLEPRRVGVGVAVPLPRQVDEDAVRQLDRERPLAEPVARRRGLVQVPDVELVATRHERRERERAVREPVHLVQGLGRTPEQADRPGSVPGEQVVRVPGPVGARGSGVRGEDEVDAVRLEVVVAGDQRVQPRRDPGLVAPLGRPLLSGQHRGAGGGRRGAGLRGRGPRFGGRRGGARRAEGRRSGGG